MLLPAVLFHLVFWLLIAATIAGIFLLLKGPKSRRTATVLFGGFLVFLLVDAALNNLRVLLFFASYPVILILFTLASQLVYSLMFAAVIAGVFLLLKRPELRRIGLVILAALVALLMICAAFIGRGIVMISLQLVLWLVPASILVCVFLSFKNPKSRRPAFLIIAGLMVLLAADAVLDHRSIPGHVLRWFRGEDGHKQTLHDLADDTQKSVDPVALQRWAMAMLQQHPQADSSYDIPRDQVPAYIQNLESLPPHHAYVRDGAVWFQWGGGLGHWGLLVGPPSFKIATDPSPGAFYNEYLEWKPGIYCWVEIQ